MSTDLSILIPVFNDQEGLKSLLPVISQVTLSSGIDCEILVIDDGSAPALVESDLPKGSSIRLLSHRRNRGYGAAIKTGIHGAHADFFLIIDADGQHNPADIPRFYAAIQNADMVVGERSKLSESPLWRLPGKLLIRALFRITGIPTNDFNCGYRCMRAAPIRRLMHLCSDRFSFSMSSTLLLYSTGYDVDFLPVVTQPRRGKSSVTVWSGFETILLLIRMVVLTRPLKIFLPASIFFVLSGTLWAIPYLLSHRGVSIGALLLLLTGLLTFFFGVLADVTAEVLRNVGQRP